jgi:hypothetical protein
MAHHPSEIVSEPLVGNARIEKIEERGQEGFDLVDFQIPVLSIPTGGPFGSVSGGNCGADEPGRALAA